MPPPRLSLFLCLSFFSVSLSLGFSFFLCLFLPLCFLCLVVSPLSVCPFFLFAVSVFSLSFCVSVLSVFRCSLALFLSSASLVLLSLCFLCSCVLPACLLFGLPCRTQGNHNKTENKLFRVHILCIGRLRLHHATPIPFYFITLPDYKEEKESSILIIFSKDHTSR